LDREVDLAGHDRVLSVTAQLERGVEGLRIGTGNSEDRVGDSASNSRVHQSPVRARTPMLTPSVSPATVNTPPWLVEYECPLNVKEPVVTG